MQGSGTSSMAANWTADLISDADPGDVVYIADITGRPRPILVRHTPTLLPGMGGVMIIGGKSQDEAWPHRPRVFLGGTCNESPWCKDLIGMLYPDVIDHFDPVVDDWTPECQEEERRQRELCDYVLYTITPRMTGVYSIAEVVDDSNKRPERTLFCVLARDGDQEFTLGQLRSLKAVAELVERNGGRCFTDLSFVASYLNGAGRQGCS